MTHDARLSSRADADLRIQPRRTRKIQNRALNVVKTEAKIAKNYAQNSVFKVF